MSNQRFGKIKIHRLNKAWLEASIIWPKWFAFQGEDEGLVLNYFITWRFVQPLALKVNDPAVWLHMKQNLDQIIKNWLMIQTNCFAVPEVKYFTFYLVQIVLDLIWKSNVNITILRRFGSVLAKCARDIESTYQGGFKKLVHVRLISKVGIVKEDHLLRKRVRQFYAIKAICLHNQVGMLDDHIEFITIQTQMDDKAPG